MKKIKVYTIQNAKVLDKLNSSGTYKTDRRFICFAHFKKPYQWLANQAKRRIPGWTEDRPIWVWLKRPDLRRNRFVYGTNNERLVLIELEVPRDQVLISDFDTWHCVLNESYLPLSNKDFDQFYEKYEKVSGDLTKPGQDLLQKSWERCINPKGNKCRQGIIEKIDKSQVKSVKLFNSKNKT